MEKSDSYRTSRSLTAVVSAIFFILLISQTRAGGRYALTIGIDQYDQLAEHAQLEVAVKDATTMSEALQNCAPGFDVKSLTNAAHADFTTGFDTFSQKANGADCVVFYFAGHGIEFHGENYLLLNDTDPNLEARSVIRTKNALELRALSMQRVLRQLGELNAKLTVVILDACRDNPFETTLAHFSPADGTTPTDAAEYIISKSGVGRVNAPAGMIISYSADAGQSANDGLFTNILAKNIQRPGLSLMKVFTETRATVSTQARRLAAEGSGVFHEPAEYLKLEPSAFDFTFNQVSAADDDAAMVATLTAKIEQLKQTLKAKPKPALPQKKRNPWQFKNARDYVFEAEMVAKTRRDKTTFTVTMDLGDDHYWVISPTSINLDDSANKALESLPPSSPAVLENRIASSLTGEVPPEAVGNLYRGAASAANYFNREKNYRASERINEALVRWLSKQSKHKNELGYAWNSLGRSLEYRKKWSKAKDCYVKQLQLSPGNTGAKSDLFRCYCELGILNEAKEILYTMPRKSVSPEMFASVNDHHGAAKLAGLIADEALDRFQKGQSKFPERELKTVIEYGTPQAAHLYSTKLLNHLAASGVETEKQFLDLISAVANWWSTCPPSVTTAQKLERWQQVKNQGASKFAGPPRMDWKLATALADAGVAGSSAQHYKTIRQSEGRHTIPGGRFPFFDGKNGYIPLPLIPFGQYQQFTLEAWVFNWENRFFCQGHHGDPENSVWGSWGASGQGLGWESRRGRNFVLPIRPFPVLEWEHIALVYDGSEMRAYLNGELYAKRARPWKPGPFKPGRISYIGTYQPSSRIKANGLFHTLRISNTARYQTNFIPATSFQTDPSTVALVIANGKDDTIRDDSGNAISVEVKGVNWQGSHRSD